MPISVTKKGRTNRDITPFHTAAINPNVSYLKTLLASGQQYGPDSDGWYVLIDRLFITPPFFYNLKLVTDNTVQGSDPLCCCMRRKWPIEASSEFGYLSHHPE